MSDVFASAKQFIDQHCSFVIVIPAMATQDAIGSATALYIGMSKLGKSLVMACAQEVKSDLIGADKIKTKMDVPGDSLMISFPYTDGAVDKVSYQIKENTFELLITPTPGKEKLDPQKVKFSYVGGKADAIICIDAPSLIALGTLYKENEKLFSSLPILNLDRHITNNNFGKVNVVDKTCSSTSEIVLKLLQVIGVEIDKQIATNLYYGLLAGTNNFTGISVNANSFQAAGFLFNCGVERKAAPNIAPGVSPFSGGGPVLSRSIP